MARRKRERGCCKDCYLYVVVGFATLGAILFGCDQGNWAGAIEKQGFTEAFCGTSAECENPETHPPDYTSFLSLGSSLVQLGAFFGAIFLGPPITGRLGRHEAMFTGSLVTIIGVVPMCLTTVQSMFMLTRFCAGVGVGIVTYALPMFISEVSPPEIRGTLGSAFQLLMVMGMIGASLLNTQDWFTYQASFSLPVYPAVIICLGIFCMPDSPRFALMKGMRNHDTEEGSRRAFKALKKLRGSKKKAEAELEDIKRSLEQQEEEAPWSMLWECPSIRKRVLIANGLQWMQQFCGINALLSFGPSMLKSAHLEMDIQVAQFIINCFNLVGTVAMMVVIDKFGRRPLLLVGAGMMFVFMAASAVLAWHMEAKEHSSGLATGLMICLCGYISFFGIGWGGVCWVYPSEIFPMDIKEKAMSTSVGSQWLANFLIAYLVPHQVAAFHLWGTFTFYAVCLLVIFLMVFFLVPETKGVPFEEMDRLFGPRLGAAAVFSDTESDVSGSSVE